MMALPHSSKYREADKETLMESARDHAPFSGEDPEAA